MKRAMTFGVASTFLISLAASAGATTTVTAAVPSLWTIWSGQATTCPNISGLAQNDTGPCNLADSAGSATNASGTNTIYGDFPLYVTGSSVNVAVMGKEGGYSDYLYCETTVCNSSDSCSNTGWTEIAGGTFTASVVSTSVGSISVGSGSFAYIACEFYPGSTVYSFTY